MLKFGNVIFVKCTHRLLGVYRFPLPGEDIRVGARLRICTMLMGVDMEDASLSSINSSAPHFAAEATISKTLEVVLCKAFSGPMPERL